VLAPAATQRQHAPRAGTRPGNHRTGKIRRSKRILDEDGADVGQQGAENATQVAEDKRKRTGIEVSEAGAKSPTINAASHDPAQLPQSFFPGAPR